MSSKISEVKAREILDSRGNPTVEVDVSSTTAHRPGGRPVRGLDRQPRSGRAARRRAAPLRGQGGASGGRQRRYEIAPALVGTATPVDQAAIDERLTEPSTARRTRARLGANAILGVSIAVARAAAAVAEHAALPVARRDERALLAGADAQRDQRWRPRRQPRSTCRSSCSRPSARRRSPRRCGWPPRPTTR